MIASLLKFKSFIPLLTKTLYYLKKRKFTYPRSSLLFLITDSFTIFDDIYIRNKVKL